MGAHEACATGAPHPTPNERATSTVKSRNLEERAIGRAEYYLGVAIPMGGRGICFPALE